MLHLMHEYNIYRSYNNQSYNISHIITDVHCAIQSQAKTQLSKYGLNADIILENFFKEYKKAAVNSGIKTTKNQLKLNAPNLTFQFEKAWVTVPFLDFKQGGKKWIKQRVKIDLPKQKLQGGLIFERDFQSLLDKAYSKQLSTSGQSGATVLIDNNTIEDFLIKAAETNLSIANSKLFRELDNKMKSSKYVSLSKRLNGKVDVKGEGNINFSFEGVSTPNLDIVIDILKTATFSLKSYKNLNSISLGHTRFIKAITAILNYSQVPSSQMLLLFYIAHPTIDAFRLTYSSFQYMELKKSYDNIYQHYEHMKKIFEISGMGLQDSEENFVVPVDFLVANNFQSDNEIMVKFVPKEILSILQKNNYSFNSH